jgi:uncharacterized LabA/DUF88 family protein
MADEPATKRAITFIDGQNLYHGLREAFASTSHPNYDVMKLSQAICQQQGWQLKAVRFYSGYPSAKDDPKWSAFWQKKLRSISQQSVKRFTRELRYRTKTFKLDNGGELKRLVGEEKGIDVRIAIDLIRLALDTEYDVAVIFSQDQDLSEAVDEIRKISRTQDRWIKIACPYPVGPGTSNARGINRTDWVPFDEAFYTPCIDPNDYR